MLEKPEASIWLDGVIYTGGTMALDSAAGVYGSVVAELGFSGGGTPDVFYNAQLAEGLILGNGNVGSPFRITLRTNF